LAYKIAHQAQGNYNKASDILHEDNDELPFEKVVIRRLGLAL
jgi:DNA polymerase-3 subunit delta'